jgi:hypothetical protein
MAFDNVSAVQGSGHSTPPKTKPKKKKKKTRCDYWKGVEDTESIICGEH